MPRFGSFFRLIALSKISMLGAVIVTTFVIAEIILVTGELFFFESNPYIGIVAYLIFPGFVVLGLLLMPFGIFWRLRAVGVPMHLESVLEFTARQKIDRVRVIQVVFLLSMINLVIFGVLGYRGFHYTESKEFCGELCHEVMHPELTTYSRSPHSEISCVECHIGAGAGWFVKSKLSGMRQVFAVMSGNFSRPIETPIHNLRPARDVCEVCHRPEIFHGNRIKVIQHFEKDKDNTRTYTVLNLLIGSGGEHGMDPHGIHWHVSKNHKVRYYATDRKRENVVWVELESKDGTKRVWKRPGFDVDGAELDEHEMRRMDCVDCHNRPTHIFLPPDVALEQWMVTGLIDPELPWIRKLAEQVLTASYDSREEADEGIANLANIYRLEYPGVWSAHREKIDQAIASLQEIHRTFVYPSMNIEWNTYNSLIGHPTTHTAACFRCHDGVLQDEEGKGITLECESCHYVLSNRELNPLILQMLEES